MSRRVASPVKLPRANRGRGAALHSRPPLARMLRLHEQLKSNSFPNCNKVAKELEVSRKTVQRDIEFMRDRLGLPIEYDQLQFGFFYSQPVTNFPSIEVTEGEMVALFVAQIALLQYKGTSFEKPLETAFKKITSGLDERITFRWEELDGTISFRGIGASISDVETFETISGAVLNRQELRFHYRKLTAKRHQLRKVQPFHLGCVENQWYLFGLDLARKQMRTFALPRIRKAVNTGLKFVRPADFSIAEHLGDSFGVYRGAEKHKVRLLFDPFAGRLVSERTWHPSQKLKPHRDGSVGITMELDSLEEIERWVMSWGSHVKILEPAALVKRVRKQAAQIVASYD